MFVHMRKPLPNKRHLILAAAIFGLVVFAFISTEQAISEHLYENFIKSLYLEDVLRSSAKPPPGRTIFFHETSCNHPDSGVQMINLTARQACAIESAALHNPNFQVFVLFTCPTHRLLSGRQKTFIEAIESSKNVQLRHLNLRTYAAGTPIEEWVKKGDLSQSSYPMQHTADLLRLISLYRFGGVYLDIDVVVLRSLENLPLNYVGAEDNAQLCNAVIGLEPDGKGHEIAEIFLQDYQHNYNGMQYTQNGPALVTRAVRKFCDKDFLEVMQEGRASCHGLKVFNTTAFYPIPWTQWSLYTDANHVEEAMARTKDSYLIHLWNKVSVNGLIKVGSQTALGKFSEKNCPKIYAAAGEYF